MPKFSYTAMDSRGKDVKGSIEADNENEAVNSLKQQGLFPTSVSSDGGAARVSNILGGGGASKSGGINIPFLSGGNVKSKNLTVFTRQLATLIGAGLPLLKSLNVLFKQERNQNLKGIIRKLADSIEGGSTFSETISAHPRVFNKLYVNMVKAGELGGVLEVVLTRLADFQEKSEKIKGKVMSAMIYPVVVLFIAMIILAFLLVFIVPKFKQIFEDMLEGRPLPLITRMVIGASGFVQQNFLIIAVLITGIIIGYKVFAATSAGRSILDRIFLSAPVFGDLIRKTAIARFTRTLGTLQTSGVPILQALNITRETAGNIVISNAIGRVHDSVKEGESVVQPLEASGVFPPMVISMIDVGEETGQLPEMLMKIADNYEDEVDNAVAAMTSLLEPIMIVLLALIVGTIVVALFLPLVDIIKSVTQAGD